MGLNGRYCGPWSTGECVHCTQPTSKDPFIARCSCSAHCNLSDAQHATYCQLSTFYKMAKKLGFSKMLGTFFNHNIFPVCLCNFFLKQTTLSLSLLHLNCKVCVIIPEIHKGSCGRSFDNNCRSACFHCCFSSSSNYIQQCHILISMHMCNFHWNWTESCPQTTISVLGLSLFWTNQQKHGIGE